MQKLPLCVQRGDLSQCPRLSRPAWEFMLSKQLRVSSSQAAVSNQLDRMLQDGDPYPDFPEDADLPAGEGEVAAPHPGPPNSSSSGATTCSKRCGADSAFRLQAIAGHALYSPVLSRTGAQSGVSCRPFT